MNPHLYDVPSHLLRPLLMPYAAPLVQVMSLQGHASKDKQRIGMSAAPGMK